VVARNSEENSVDEVSMTLLEEGFVVLICCFVVAYVFFSRSEDKKSLQVALVGVGSFAGVATVADVATVATVADVTTAAGLSTVDVNIDVGGLRCGCSFVARSFKVRFKVRVRVRVRVKVKVKVRIGEK